MKKLYAKFVLWLIRPALEQECHQRHAGVVVLGSVGAASKRQLDAQQQDIRSRIGRLPDLHP